MGDEKLEDENCSKRDSARQVSETYRANNKVVEKDVRIQQKYDSIKVCYDTVKELTQRSLAGS